MTSTNPEGEDKRVSAIEQELMAEVDGPKPAIDQHADAQQEGFGKEDERIREGIKEDGRDDSSSDAKDGDAPTNDDASNGERTE